MMKTQISLVLLSLGLACSSAYAGAMPEPLPVSNDINVTGPDQSGMWSFGGTVVLMQPTNKEFNYADVTSQIDSGNNAHTEIDHNTVGESYHWWFGADITYAFPGNGRDVTLAYEGLHGNDTDNTAVDGPTFPVQPTFMHSSFTQLPYLTASGKTETNYDAGDLVFGQKMDIGHRVRLHPFVGLRYAYINTRDTAYYTGGGDVVVLFGSGTSTEDSKLENTFNGIGPRFGSDAQIDLSQGFSIRARLGLSALIGSRDVENTAVITNYAADGTVNAVRDGVVNNDSATQVVPEIDGRLGLNYTHNFASNMALGFEAGWQATNYFNVIADQFQSGGNFPTGTTEHYQENSNFGLQGPYARIQLDIA